VEVIADPIIPIGWVVLSIFILSINNADYGNGLQTFACTERKREDSCGSRCERNTFKSKGFDEMIVIANEMAVLMDHFHDELNAKVKFHDRYHNA
jgi:hypothetical protein